MTNPHIHYRIDQVARTLNCLIPDVHRLLASGEIEGVRCRKATRVTAASLRSYLERTGPFAAAPEPGVRVDTRNDGPASETAATERIPRRFTIAAPAATGPNRRAA